MKHTYLIFVLFLISFSLSAQSVGSIVPSTDTIPFKMWSFGAQLSDFEIGKYNFNFGLGLFAERRLSKNFGLEAELSYIRESYENRAVGNWQNQYARASISGKYYFGQNRRWFGKAGIQADYYLASNFIEKFNEANPTAPFPIRDASFKDKLSPSFLLGVGYEVPLRNGGGLKFEFNYNHENKFTNSKSNFKVGYRF